ncbi:zincin [Gonapodya prolifera JEL478]|uniref:Zincin n=1 Tax=Gonapodya prolifera (strain JEL478) TaxID=1344416 RepID=A0A139ACZ2_GONPJ|nr:zincin [Gonapodya prolifera JEL478]|eukprot:KXS14454.1 zincin [Gonapodya prolifera JEL478]
MLLVAQRRVHRIFVNTRSTDFIQSRNVASSSRFQIGFLSRNPSTSRTPSSQNQHRTIMVASDAKPRPNPLDMSPTPEGVETLADRLIADGKAVDDEIAVIPLGEAKADFSTVFEKMSAVENVMEASSANVHFWQYVSTEKSVREASMAADKKMRDFAVESGMREDVYLRVQEAFQSVKAKINTHGPEDIRFAEKVELDYRRNGLALPKDVREQLTVMKKRMSELSIAFSKNVNEDETSLLFTKEELEGMPEDYFAGLKKEDKDGKEFYRVTMKASVTAGYPDIIPAMRMCRRESTRKALDFANTARCEANVENMTEMVNLRRRVANLMGYPNHAAFRLEVKMAKTPKEVTEFLDDLTARLIPYAEKELSVLLEIKRKEKEERREVYDGKINSWDFNYYNRMLLEKEYEVDDQAIKQYFSLSTVTDGMLDIYQEVLGLKCVEIPSAPTWHPDVRLIEVSDALSGEFIGQFYLDLFPRDNKYTHAACFGLVPGFVSKDGSRQHPVAAMVANFSKPTADKPSLLKHDEVVTYFHELGHVFHQMLALTKHARFHGTRVERDFVEAPSQMLENWCWQPEILHRLSKHHETGEHLPAAVVEKLVRAKNVNAGLLNLRQIFFGRFDMAIHTLSDEASEDALDIKKLYLDLRESVTLIPGQPETYGAATFGHLMGGYDAGYYGYLWSQVFSADMFMSRFKSEGILNPATGKSYRSEILRPGGSKDGMDMLVGFLGRRPEMDPFLVSLGLKSLPAGVDKRAAL